MIGGKRVVAVIPARGGSKTVPGKNVRLLGGKPLIVWSIDTAKRVPAIDRIIVSTDGAEIARVSRECGAEVYGRPEQLATDTALVIDALKDLAERLRREGETAEIMVLLEPTCPLRSAEDVSLCLEAMSHEGLDSVATFKDAELNPHRAWTIEEGRPRVFIPGAVPWLPRQRLPQAWQLTGAVYAFLIDRLAASNRGLLFDRPGAVVMPKWRSVDIDDDFDFELAELIIKRGTHEQDPR